MQYKNNAVVSITCRKFTIKTKNKTHTHNEHATERISICNYPLGHFKKTEVLIFGAALGFSHYLVHLKPIGTILSEINQYRRIGFEVFVLWYVR